MQTATATPDLRRGNALGLLLREWRTTRGMSQLDLAMRAGFSARHVSFIETGRTQPSRHALLVLAESLELPLRERNRLLEAGGFAHVYRHTPLGADEMAHIVGVLRFILDRHKPYAAVVLDRYSNCVMGNGASEQLVRALVDSSLIAERMNYLRLVFHPLGVRRWIVNWEDVSHTLLARAERELGELADDDAVALVSELHDYVGSSLPYRARRPSNVADLLLPIHIRKDDFTLRLFSTIMTLGTPQDVTLQELRIETFFPADASSENAWRRMTANGTSGDSRTGTLP
jgi:transcriptional regulator with XRE-family HTH domain